MPKPQTETVTHPGCVGGLSSLTEILLSTNGAHARVPFLIFIKKYQIHNGQVFVLNFIHQTNVSSIGFTVHGAAPNCLSLNLVFITCSAVVF